jgi:hypothetical protein
MTSFPALETYALSTAVPSAHTIIKTAFRITATPSSGGYPYPINYTCIAAVPDAGCYIGRVWIYASDWTNHGWPGTHKNLCERLARVPPTVGLIQEAIDGPNEWPRKIKDV